MCLIVQIDLRLFREPVGESSGRQIHQRAVATARLAESQTDRLHSVLRSPPLARQVAQDQRLSRTAPVAQVDRARDS